MGGGIERRRLARIPLRCTVVVREKLATTEAETEDVGARGCRIVLRRPAAPGTLLQIRFDLGADGDPLEAVGQVVWARKAAPLTAGVRFVSAPRAAAAAPGGNWLEHLVAAHLRRVARGELELGALAHVQLDAPAQPRQYVPHDFAAARIARTGGTVATIAASVGGVGAVALLLERGAVVVARAHVVAPGANEAAVERPASSIASPVRSAIVPPPPPALGRAAGAG